MKQDGNKLVKSIEKLLGHPIQDQDRFIIALTHRSYVNEKGSNEEDNERMEFLGDAVLDLVVSDILMKIYPEEQEGFLSKYRSAIVNEKSLAQAARAMSLGEFIRLGKGEENTQGREKDSILANTFEAVVAALYLSGGLSDAKLFVAFHLDEVISRAEKSPERHDYKTALQEFTQKSLKITPNYELMYEGGPDHDKVFESRVLINDRVCGEGRAKSKKDSEQISAKAALRLLQSDVDDSA